MEDMIIAGFNLEKSKEIANKFADEYGKPYVVLKNSVYQVEYVWSTEDEDNV